MDETTSSPSGPRTSHPGADRGLDPAPGQPVARARPRPLIRLNAQERQARAAALRGALDRMRAIPDEPGDDPTDLLRALDESNPGRFHLARFYGAPDPR